MVQISQNVFIPQSHVSGTINISIENEELDNMGISEKNSILDIVSNNSTVSSLTTTDGITGEDPIESNFQRVVVMSLFS